MKRDGLTLGWGMAGCSWIAGTISRRGERPTPRRRHGPRRVRHAGHRHRHLHDPRAARLAEDRRPARQNRSGARRYVASGRPALGRFDGDRLGGPGRLCSGRQRDRIAADASRRRRRDRRSRSASPTDLAFEDGRVFVKADGAREWRAVRGLAPARQPPPGHRQRQVRSDVRQSASRSSRRTRSAVTSSRSPGNRRSLGCASAGS